MGTPKYIVSVHQTKPFKVLYRTFSSKGLEQYKGDQVNIT